MRKNINRSDYFDLEFDLPTETLTVRKEIQSWVNAEILPCIESHAQNHTTDIGWFQALGALGCLGGNLPRSSGGRNWSDLTYGWAMQELERGDSALRTMASVQGGLVMYPISELGTKSQKEQYLSKLASGQMIGCFGLTEQLHGSNPKGMETRLITRENHFILRGNKAWITNAPIADVGVVWAKNEEDHIVAILLDMNREGVVKETITDKWSLRASITGHLRFEDVRIEQQDLLPGVLGLKSALTCLNKARYGIAWGAVGSALACYESALNYVTKRRQFGKFLAEFQLVQKKLAEMLTSITQAQLMNYQLAKLSESGRITTGQISMAKRAHVEMALVTARHCRQILGAEGVRSTYPVMRHLMNLETVVTYEGSHDIHLLVTGQDITGYSAFT